MTQANDNSFRVLLGEISKGESAIWMIDVTGEKSLKLLPDFLQRSNVVPKEGIKQFDSSLMAMTTLWQQDLSGNLPELICYRSRDQRAQKNEIWSFQKLLMTFLNKSQHSENEKKVAKQSIFLNVSDSHPRFDYLYQQRLHSVFMSEKLLAQSSLGEVLSEIDPKIKAALSADKNGMPDSPLKESAKIQTLPAKESTSISGQNTQDTQIAASRQKNWQPYQHPRYKMGASKDKMRKPVVKHQGAFHDAT